MPTSRPASTMRRRISGRPGWSVTAAPTRPTRRASSGISAITRAGLDQAHAAVGRAAHHAVGAAARAAALGLDQEHVATARCAACGSASRRAGCVVGRRGDRRAGARRGATARRSRGARPGRASSAARSGSSRTASTSSAISSSASPMSDHVGERAGRQRVREGQRAADDDQRDAAAARGALARRSAGMPARSRQSTRPASSSS